MPKGGSEIGILLVAASFVLAVLTAGQWIGQTNYADNHSTEDHHCGFDAYGDDKYGDDHADEDHADDGYGDEDHADEENSLEALYPGESAAAYGALAEGGGEGSAICPVIATTTWWSNGGVDFTVGTLVDGLTFAFLSLFTAAMLFFVTSENILQMIVGWELVGVCSFTLIGHWWEEKENSDAALKAFMTNRVGDSA